MTRSSPTHLARYAVGAVDAPSAVPVVGAALALVAGIVVIAKARDGVDGEPRGFAAMTPEKRAALSRLGGFAVGNKRHRWTSEAAAVAGRAGGTATQARKREA